MEKLELWVLLACWMEFVDLDVLGFCVCWGRSASLTVNSLKTRNLELDVLFFDVLVVLLSDFLVLWMVGCGFHLESLFFSCIFFLGKIQGWLFLFLFSD